MKVLVTGADGFIGSHLVQLLLLHGFDVKALCLYTFDGSCGWLDTLPNEQLSNIEILRGDVRDSSYILTVSTDCSIIFNLAALIGIPYSYTAPRSYIDTNLLGTLNILESARFHGDIRVVQTSTSETYGTAQYVPIDEKHPLSAQSPYAASKIAADQLSLSYFKSFSLPVTVLRPFNTYGPRQSQRAVIPTIISQLLSDNPRLQLGSLSPTRDFNYVTDTCSAFLNVALSESCIGETINACSNFEVSIATTVELLSSIIGSSPIVDLDTNRVRPASSEVTRLYGDNSKLISLTKWRPQYSGIDGFKQGLLKTVEWFSVPSNLSLYKSSYSYSV